MLGAARADRRTGGQRVRRDDQSPGGVPARQRASDGAWGWGEVFSNFPQVGAEHRARLVDSIFAPLLIGVAADDPAPVRAMLERRTRQMAIQCGEPGPFAQITGAVDQALWDMAARRAGRAAVEASGRPESRARVRERHRTRSRRRDRRSRNAPKAFRAFKLKVGFGAAARRRQSRCDARRARRRGHDHVRRQPGVDAGRSAGAHRRARAVSPALDRGADRRRPAACGVDVRLRARARSRSPPARTCAAMQAFDEAIDAGYLAFVQPDVGKWGGISGGLDVARHAGVRATSRTVRTGSPAASGSPRRCMRSRRQATRKATRKSTPIRIRCARRCSRSSSTTAGSRCPTARARRGAGLRAARALPDSSLRLA